MSRNSQWIRALVIAPFIVFLLLPGLALAAKSKPAKVDLNTASQKELEDLPGVGEATAKKIVAGRPYSSVGDLEKAGVPKSTVDKIKKLVTVSKATAAEKPVAEKQEKKSTKSETKVAASALAGPVDLNTASQKELEDLPGVGAATAKKIIAGRPYSSVDDLAKAGVSKRTITKIGSLVTVGSGKSRTSASTASSSASSSSSESRSTASSKTSSSEQKTEAVPAQPPPSKGMVWVNTATKVFHREGDRWYGNTKHGKYMTEADAIKAGYREAKK